MRLYTPLAVVVTSLSLLSGCTRVEQLQTPQGLVSVRTSYPQYEPIRTTRQLSLSLADQDGFRHYYRHHRHWPLSVPGFVAESDTNYALVAGLRRKGFADLEFVSRGPDSLHVNFTFYTLGNLKTDKYASIDGLGRAFHGYFLFVADPVSGISFQQVLPKELNKGIFHLFDRKHRPHDTFWRAGL